MELQFDKSFGDITDESGNMILDLESYISSMDLNKGDTITITVVQSLPDGDNR